LDWVGYIATLQKRVEEMQHSDDYSCRSTLNPGMLPSDIEEIEGYLRAEPSMENVRVSDDLRAFYEVTSSFYFRWYFEGERANPWRLVRRGDGYVNVSYGAPGGYTHIALLSEIYTPVERYEAGERDLPFASLYEDYRTLDSIAGDRVCLRFYKDREDPSLFYYRKDSTSYHPLSLNFTSYMETLLEVRALRGWQQFFIEDPTYPIEPEWVEWFHESLERLFPAVDVARFQRLCS